MIRIEFVDKSKITYRGTTSRDGAEMWRLVRDSGRLDLNSPYCYLLLGECFADSCRVAVHEAENKIVGMVTGFRQPDCPGTLFVWQIAVDPSYRKRGIAGRLLDELAELQGIATVEATISPSNHASRNLFMRWAAARKAKVAVTEGFGKEQFPDGVHESEQLYRITLGEE